MASLIQPGAVRAPQDHASLLAFGAIVPRDRAERFAELAEIRRADSG